MTAHADEGEDRSGLRGAKKLENNHIRKAKSAINSSSSPLSLYALEKVDRAAELGNEHVYILLAVIEIKTSPHTSGSAEGSMQRLCAVMSSADCDTLLIEEE
jgi:hypothetical protein